MSGGTEPIRGPIREVRAPSLSAVESARDRIAGVAIRTPLIRLDGWAGEGEVHLKLENLQPYGSFKIRAATNAIRSLSDAERAGGIVTASAGNFAQGLAAAARDLGVTCCVVVPDLAARAKVEALEGLGANLLEVPFDEWWQVLTTRRAPASFSSAAAARFVHPVAEPEVIAGNATIALEILEDLPDVDRVLVPVGGGGLAAGIGSVLKAKRPRSELIATESEAATPVAAALLAGRPVEVEYRKSFIDGMGGRTVLPEMWPLLSRLFDHAVASTLDEVRQAVLHLVRHHHVVAEGAGAAPVAAVLAGHVRGPGKTVCVVSGGNLDPAVLLSFLSPDSRGLR